VNNTFSVPLTATPASAYTFTSSSRIQDHIIRVGLNYRLGGGTDQPARTSVASAACPGCNWGGFYLGANVGGSIGRDRTNDTVSLAPTAPSAGVTNPISDLSATHSPAGVLGGGQIGFNWQINKWVLGVEGDWDWTSQRDTIQNHSFLASTVVVAPASLDYSDQQKIKWLATARARLGWAQDCFLWYVTGGAAWGQVSSNYTFQATGLNLGGTTVFGTGAASFSSSATKSGWTVGAGVETSLAWMGVPTNRWSTKLEYLYVDLGTVSNTFSVPLTTTPASAYTFAGSSRIQDHIVRFGLNYRLGG
jgi:outer membrane immunogenic protein